MFAAYVAVQDKKIYVRGGHSPSKEAEDHVYVHDLTTANFKALISQSVKHSAKIQRMSIVGVWSMPPRKFFLDLYLAAIWKKIIL